MFAKRFMTTSIIASLLGCTNAFSNPASTEYVKAAVDGLRNELSGVTNQLNQTINVLKDQSYESNSQITSKIDAVQNQVNELPLMTHHIGELFQGGIIFYVDESRQHGLMASLHDVGQTSVEWRNGEGGDRVVNAQAHGLGSGEHNTRLIIAEQTIDQQEGSFAALRAANYHTLADGSPCPAVPNPTLTCYGGWFLPSIYELALVHSNLKKHGLGQLAEEFYWSSTEANTTQAWLTNFGTGETLVNEKSSLAHVRAIHTF